MEIAALRAELDRIDTQILALLDRRIAVVHSISSAKVEAGIAPRDTDREQQMLNAARNGKHEVLRPEEAASFQQHLLAFTRRCVRRRGVQPEPLRIAVIGLGLIGGSLAKALKQAQPGHKLYGVDLEDRLDGPRATGLFDKLFSAKEGADGVKRADVVFLCTPVERALKLLEILAQDVPKAAIVTDVGGVKGVISDAAKAAFNFPDAPYFVGGHPMAGKALCGFEHSDADLFDGRAWILTPESGDPVDKLNRLRGLIESAGASLRLMTPAEHDRSMAFASHLPQLAATALMLVVGDRADAIAGPALRDMTRLASSRPAMWNELAAHVRPDLLAELQSFRSYLTELEMAVSFGEPLDKWFDRANRLRASLEGVAGGDSGA